MAVILQDASPVGHGGIRPVDVDDGGGGGEMESVNDGQV